MRKIQPIVEFFKSLFPGETNLNEDAAAFVKNSVWYSSLDYQTLESWSRSRRVVTKIDYNEQQVKTRFVVTSLSARKIPPGQLYTHKYCPRGNMENRLKEQKLDLQSDRTSTHTFAGNQLRLWFAAIAYILINEMRETCLVNTEFKNSTIETIRAKLLKLGAVITKYKRKTVIAISNACPYQYVFAVIYECLSRLPCPG